MKTILFALACTLATTGCKKSENKGGGAGSAATCSTAINRAIDGMMASRKQMIADREKAGQAVPPGMLEGMNDIANKLRTVLTTRCEADKWSEAVITCFANASDQPGIKKCREGLPPEQAQALQAEIIKVMGGGMGPGGGGHGGPMGGGMGGAGHPVKPEPATPSDSAGSAGSAAPAGSAGSAAPVGSAAESGSAAGAAK
ncbi:MAG: hypothetical protein SFX73_25500 [Kofleriaceae bacterium]|nr:hypothetical protein [Kofleriaceae bacterium]